MMMMISKPLLSSIIAPFLLLASSHPTTASAQNGFWGGGAFDQLTAWKECSMGEKEWSICLQPSGYGVLWYCPTVDESVSPVVNGSTAPLEDINFYGIQTNFLPCFSCPTTGSPNGDDCESTMARLVDLHNITQDTNPYEDVPAIGLQMCVDLCESGLDGDACSDEYRCTAGSHFCNFEDNGGTSGTCRDCPTDIDDCLQDGFLTSDLSRMECQKCRLACYDVGNSSLVVDGENIVSVHMQLAFQEPRLSGLGPLVDCSDLILADIDVCPNARGSVCLVEDYTADTLFWQLTNKAEKNGCVAVVKFMTNSTSALESHHSYDHLAIPCVDIDSDVGKYLKEEKIGSLAHVESELWGNACWPPWEGTFCSNDRPCPDSVTDSGEGFVNAEDLYCDFTWVVRDGKYVEGQCEACPTSPDGEPDPAGCFFRRDNSESDVKTQEAVESCANSCKAALNFGDCKFCPSDLTAFEFGVDDKADQCAFCPHNDVLYPDRFVPLFGANITCSSMQAFFERVEVNKHSGNCLLAQSYNFICGCQGPGYVGANTQAKKNALVWMPRVSAILSVLGSLFVLVDVLKTRMGRGNLFNQLMAQISIFDIIGSFAYAFTSLPVPKEQYIQGSHGSDKTCTAQGFFIQLGTIAAYTNVSLAFFFFFKIRQGWSDMRLRKVSLWFFACPIIVGMAFAFAGIPFMGNMILWCNNSAAWWPDIPVAIAIFVATVTMGLVCWNVRKTAIAQRRWAQGGSTRADALSQQVFWQSFWYLMAFYMTWPPYLALQYLWASKMAYSNYGFILYAGTVVPLQGAWNFFVYARNRQLQGLRESLAGSLRKIVSFRFSSKSGTNTASTQTLSHPNASEAKEPGIDPQKKDQGHDGFPSPRDDAKRSERGFSNNNSKEVTQDPSNKLNLEARQDAATATSGVLDLEREVAAEAGDVQNDEEDEEDEELTGYSLLSNALEGKQQENNQPEDKTGGEGQMMNMEQSPHEEDTDKIVVEGATMQA